MKTLYVYNESATGWCPVGRLWHDGNTWCFQYEQDWLTGEARLRLGPDLPLSSEILRAKELFISFTDRLPSAENPGYSALLRCWKVGEVERDPIRLLSTLGHRGPSSFVFEDKCRAVETGKFAETEPKRAA